jgi:hypothetical protein
MRGKTPALCAVTVTAAPFSEIASREYFLKDGIEVTLHGTVVTTTTTTTTTTNNKTFPRKITRDHLIRVPIIKNDIAKAEPEMQIVRYVEVTARAAADVTLTRRAVDV